MIRNSILILMPQSIKTDCASEKKPHIFKHKDCKPIENRELRGFYAATEILARFLKIYRTEINVKTTITTGGIKWISVIQKNNKWLKKC